MVISQRKWSSWNLQYSDATCCFGDFYILLYHLVFMIIYSCSFKFLQQVFRILVQIKSLHVLSKISENIMLLMLCLEFFLSNRLINAFWHQEVWASLAPAARIRTRKKVFMIRCFGGKIFLGRFFFYGHILLPNSHLPFRYIYLYFQRILKPRILTGQNNFRIKHCTRERWHKKSQNVAIFPNIVWWMKDSSLVCPLLRHSSSYLPRGRNVLLRFLEVLNGRRWEKNLS